MHFYPSSKAAQESARNCNLQCLICLLASHIFSTVFYSKYIFTCKSFNVRRWYLLCSFLNSKYWKRVSFYTKRCAQGLLKEDAWLSRVTWWACVRLNTQEVLKDEWAEGWTVREADVRRTCGDNVAISHCVCARLSITPFLS